MSEWKSSRKVCTNFVIFIQSNKSGDSYAAKERSSLEITDAEVQEIDLAENKPWLTWWKLFGKGLVFSNPAVGGWLTGERVKIFRRPDWGGTKKFYIPFEESWNIPFGII